MLIKKKNGKNQEREKGFTLVEVMVAIGILAFGILAIASMQVAALSGTTIANNLTEGTTVAMDKMEKLMSYPLAHADLAIAGHGPETVGTAPVYTVNWTVAAVGTNNTRTITLNVSWLVKGVTKNTQLINVRNVL